MTFVGLIVRIVAVARASRTLPFSDGLFFHVYRPDKIGTDTIHHDSAHPSRLVLPVLDVK